MRLPSRLPPDPELRPPALAFHVKCLRALDDAAVPFMVGGAYALKYYARLERDTKDLDLFVARDDLDAARAALGAVGIHTEITFTHWLGKALQGPYFIDIIFNSGNGCAPVTRDWLVHAPIGKLYGRPVRICPVEETIWSKAFVMERERFDGADVAHLLRAQAATLDWGRLVDRFGSNGRVLLAHLVFFGFVYPDQADLVPSWVLDRLWAQVRSPAAPERGNQVCRGTLLSREQYLFDLERGYKDARLPPEGAMTVDEIAAWTEAIATRR